MTEERKETLLAIQDALYAEIVEAAREPVERLLRERMQECVERHLTLITADPPLVSGTDVRVIQDEGLMWDRVKQIRRERFERGEPRHPQDEMQAVREVVDKAVSSALVIDTRQMATFVAHVTAVIYSEGCRKIY